MGNSTVHAVMIGSSTFAIMGVAIFKAEEFMQHHFKCAVAILVALGVVHMLLKLNGIPMETPPAP